MGSAWSRLQQIVRSAPNAADVDGEVDVAQEAENGRGRRSDRPAASPPNVFFGSHFLMGGERYDLCKPGAFLFGENWDLELLGNKPVQFPYTRHPVADPVQTLNSLINVRRDSVKLNKFEESDGTESRVAYRLEFILDCDCDCYVQIHFLAKEIVSGNTVQIALRHSNIRSSEKFYFQTGASQLFDKFIFYPEDYDISMLRYESGQFFPVVIEVRTTEYGLQEQVQTTLASVEQSTDYSQILVLKPLKQKLIVDGVTYLLQEIFGIENKDYDSSAIDENGSECIICMSDVRDTVILPCRHLCICNGCAETLRYKLNNCPICRSPFRALLQLKTMRVVTLASVTDAPGLNHHNKAQTKYETSTLVEALNGPVNHVPSCVSPMSTATTGDAVTTVHVPTDSLSAECSSNLRNSMNNKSNKPRPAKIQQVLTMKPAAPAESDSFEDIEMQTASSFKNQSVSTEEEAENEDPVKMDSVQVECPEVDKDSKESEKTRKRSDSETSLSHKANSKDATEAVSHATLVVVESVDLQTSI